MRDPKKPVFRARVFNNPFELRIVIPVRRHWLAMFFVGGFLVVWSGGLVCFWLLAGLRLWGELPDPYDMLADIGIWLASTGFLLCLFMWPLVGREVITVGYKSLTVRREMLGLGVERDFELGRIRRLRFAPFNYRAAGWGPYQIISPALLLHVFCGEIVFEYEGQTHCFGMKLDRREVKHLIELIKKHLLHSLQCRESSP